MAIANLGIALSAYAGTRRTETARRRQRKVRLRALNPAASSAALSQADRSEPAEHVHYLRTSGLAGPRNRSRSFYYLHRLPLRQISGLVTRLSPDNLVFPSLRRHHP